MWSAECILGSDTDRSIHLRFSVAVYLFWSLLFYNATQAPNWTQGNYAMIGMAVLLFCVTMTCYFLQRRQERQENVEYEGGVVDAEKIDTGNEMKHF